MMMSLSEKQPYSSRKQLTTCMFFTGDVKQWPLAAIEIITAKKEETRRSGVKSEK